MYTSVSTAFRSCTPTSREPLWYDPAAQKAVGKMRCALWSWPDHTGRSTSKPQTKLPGYEITNKLIYVATDTQQKSGDLNNEWTHLWYRLNRSDGTAKCLPTPQRTVWCRMPNSLRNGRGVLLARRNGRGVGDDAITVPLLYWPSLYTTWERSKASLRSGKT